MKPEYIKTQQDWFKFNAYISEYVGKKPFYVTVNSKIKEKKTNEQTDYVHLLIKKYLTDVLFDKGNIECNSEHLAKEWIKEYCGYGEKKTFTFKGVKRERFIPFSFADKDEGTKERLMEIISTIIRICAMVGVVIPEPEDYKLNGGV